MGWDVQNIFPMAQFFDATMIGRLRAYFGVLHDFFPIDMEFGFKKTMVP